MKQSEEIDQEKDTAEEIINFFEGRTFKIIASILVVFGLAFALFTGGIPTSRIPAINKVPNSLPQGYTRNAPPANATRKRAENSRSYRRFKSAEEQKR